MLGGSKLLTALILVAAVSFGVRFSSLIREIMNPQSSTAYAAGMDQELNNIKTAAGEPAPPASELKNTNDVTAPEKPAAPVIKAPDTKPPEIGEPEASKKDAQEPATGEGNAKKEDWRGAEDLDDEYSDVKIEMFSDLAKRRKDLETKEKELAMREALLKAAQAELQQKTDELNGIKSDIQDLLKQQTEKENERIASLVKIYEGMKPKDAANIFNSLDIDVLLEVVTKMSERKSAPIFAAMDPDRARQVTTLLAEQNKLPDLPSLPPAQ